MAADAARKICEDDLPDTLAEIADVIGLAKTLDLVSAYGGLTIRLPGRFDPTHPLVGVIGHASTAALCERFAGEIVYIPKLEAAIRRRRNTEIVSRYDNGTPVEILARAYNLSSRQIWHVIAAERSTDHCAQDDLFPD